MGLVSSVSHLLQDRCEADENPISLQAVHILGDDHIKCCTQIYYSLALITKGSVRTLVRSVEESNGAETRRLVHSRYAPDTQRLDAKDHGTRETLGRTPRRPRIRLESLGTGSRSVGTCLRNFSRRPSKVLGDGEHGSVLPQRQPASGNIRQQRRASKRVAAMVQFHTSILEPLNKPRRLRATPTGWKLALSGEGRRKGQGQRQQSTGPRAPAIGMKPRVSTVVAEAQEEVHMIAPTGVFP